MFSFLPIGGHDRFIIRRLIRSMDRWKDQLDFESWHVVRQRYAPAMKARNCRNQTEAQPIARRASAPFQPIKALEHMFELVGRNAGTVVRDCQDYLIIA